MIDFVEPEQLERQFQRRAREAVDYVVVERDIQGRSRFTFIGLFRNAEGFHASVTREWHSEWPDIVIDATVDDLDTIESQIREKILSQSESVRRDGWEQYLQQWIGEFYQARKEPPPSSGEKRQGAKRISSATKSARHALAEILATLQTRSEPRDGKDWQATTRVLSSTEIDERTLRGLAPGERAWLEGVGTKRRLNKTLHRLGYLRQDSVRDETSYYSDWTNGEITYRVYHYVKGYDRRAVERVV